MSKVPYNRAFTRLAKPQIVLTTEHAEQSMLFQWVALASGRTPELRALYAIPNWFGVHTARQGGLAKKEGRKAGVPDVHLPVARGKYHSLYVEMKVGKNKPSALQEEWHAILREHGNAVRVCYSCDAAKDAILAYLNNGAA